MRYGWGEQREDLRVRHLAGHTPRGPSRTARSHAGARREARATAGVLCSHSAVAATAAVTACGEVSPVRNAWASAASHHHGPLPRAEVLGGEGPPPPRPPGTRSPPPRRSTPRQVRRHHPPAPGRRWRPRSGAAGGARSNRATAASSRTTSHSLPDLPRKTRCTESPVIVTWRRCRVVTPKLPFSSVLGAARMPIRSMSRTATARERGSARPSP